MLPRLKIEGDWFVDADRRRHLLRGVNLGGDCKVPFPDGGTHLPTDFSDHRTVSFVGRPFPEDEADEHFGRLKAWGFNCLRLLTAWEAVEHGGPGVYDTDYLDYYARLCAKAGDYGLYVFIDFHQDVWSRMSGGDGAPGWTFEAVGLDFTRFHAAGAAHVMQHKYDFARGGRQEDNYPEMTWAQNYRYPANGIMWTLFFAGNAFCPGFRIDGEPVQDYLQRHYLGAMAEIAKRVKPLTNVLGFDSLNEPGSGYVGQPMSYRHLGPCDTNPAPVRPGIAWSPLDGLLVAQGVTRTIPDFALDREAMQVKRAEDRVVNPDGVSIWREGRCPFEEAGAYRFSETGIHVGDEDFFVAHDGKPYDMEQDFMGPFFARVAETVRAIEPDWLLFAELDPQAGHHAGFPPETPERTVNASHWYDIVTLGTKTFTYPEKVNPYTGRSLVGAAEIERAYTRHLGRIKDAAKSLNGGAGAPTLIGEFGIPFDLNGAEAYLAWADGDHSEAPWEMHTIALDLMYNAMDTLLLHSTQWNYTASNRNDLAIGDGWNQEDLSIFSRDQQTEANDLDSGGRGLKGFVRPFAQVTGGVPEEVRFDRASGEFEFVFQPDGDGETVLFVPQLHYPDGYATEVTGGRVIAEDRAAQTMRISADADAIRVIVRISRA